MLKHNNQFSQPHWLREYLDEIHDFPKPGIIFQSYTKLMRSADAFHKTINIFVERYAYQSLDVIAGLDARGFIFGSALAFALKKPFIMFRKPGKLPGDVQQIEYALEYGCNSLEVTIDSIHPGERILIIDDVLATGGTASAACMLIKKLNAIPVEAAFLIELTSLKGRQKISCPVFSVMQAD